MTQFLFLAGAGFVLFWLSRRLLAYDRRLGTIALLGLLARLALGEALFWIPYLDLPVGRGLQIENGLWFFAPDGVGYLSGAISAASGGVRDILLVNRTSASVTYVQALAVFVMLFGAVASVAVLLNGYAYLLTCWVIAAWSRHHPGSRGAATFAVAAISLSPSGILWATQPLKDPFFQFLVVAFFGAAAMWQRAWPSERPARPVAVALLAMCVTLFAVAGVRWYFAFAIVGAGTVFLLHVALASPGRRAVALAVSVLAWVLLARAFLDGAGPFVPPAIQAVLSPVENATRVLEAPTTMATAMTSARQNFERTGGSTAIVAGNPPSEVTAPPPAPSGSAEVSDGPGRSVLDGSAWGAGAAALVLPSFLRDILGVARINGGRGLLWFADVDTVVFDLVLVCAFAALLTSHRRFTFFQSPVFWLVTICTACIAFPLVYTVTNFGTLFRLRGMVQVGLALIPLAAATVRTPAARGIPIRQEATLSGHRR